MKINFVLRQLELRKLRNKAKKAFQKRLLKGDFVSVIYYDLEKEQVRLQQFTGICTRISSRGLNTKVVVRNTIASAVVEQQFFLYSPAVLDIAILAKR